MWNWYSCHSFTLSRDAVHFLSLHLNRWSSFSFYLFISCARQESQKRPLHTLTKMYSNHSHGLKREMNFSIVINRIHSPKSSWESCILIATFIHSTIVNNNNKKPSIDSCINQIHLMEWSRMREKKSCQPIMNQWPLLFGYIKIYIIIIMKNRINRLLAMESALHCGDWYCCF